MCPVAALTAPANLVNSHVVRAVRRRGNLNNGANYGPRYVNANNAPSNANWNYGSGHYSIVQSYPQQSSSQTVRCSSVVPQGIEIPSDWNRLGRLLLEAPKGMKRHEPCRVYLGKILHR